MPSIKEYDNKLKSLKNTSKLTKTMKMVSASKLRKAQDLQRESSEFAALCNDFIARLAASVESADHPLLLPREETNKVLLLVYTSDKGLCAGFNNNLIRMLERWIAKHRDDFEQVDLSFCGRRGFTHFRSRETVCQNYDDVTKSPNFSDASRINDDICRAYIDGDYDAVYLVYNVFKSALSQAPTLQKILPIESREFMKGGDPISNDYIFEPGKKELLNRMLPKTIGFKIFYALLENSAGEHGARMTAMDNATKNASDLIDKNTLLRNRARQAAITTELTEIVAGAEAL